MHASSSPSLGFSRCEGRYTTSPSFAITPPKGSAVHHHSTATGQPSPLHLPTVIFYPRFQPTPSFPPMALRDFLPRRADTSIQATTEFLYFRSKPQPSSLREEITKEFEERKIELKAKALEIYQASDADIKVCC
ncbi:hypothetical protein ZIOFF_044871 [Zingiber officinale]|uniref:Uncharacterized protein n=1 Tax=Zingiber officinale TaxID=94328 RepID=A0A8J5G1Y8_ZINOF|nr:hypothetical protein ZIOFF_044871 [Zingiber officinale]